MLEFKRDQDLNKIKGKPMSNNLRQGQAIKDSSIIRLVRIIGASIVAGGFFVGMDVAGFGTMLGLGDPLDRQIVAAMLLLIGAGDIIVIPRLLEKMREVKSSQERV